MRHLLAALCFLSHALPPPATALPPPVVPQCLGVSVASVEEGEKELDKLESGGFAWVGLPLRWDGVEKAKGVYDFTDIDSLVSGLGTRHLKPLFVLDGGNSLYPTRQEATLAYPDFLIAAVRHFGHKKVLWEIGPSVSAPFAAHTIKAADPAATVVIALDPDDAPAQFGQGLLADVDAVSLTASAEDAPESAVDSDEAARRLVQTHAPPGRDIALISSPPPDARQEARLVLRRCLSDLADGVRLSLTDGTSDEALVPQSVLPAEQTLSRTLAGLRFVKRIPLVSSEDYLLLFGGGAGELKMVAWTARPDHEILLPLSTVTSLTGMTGDVSAPESTDGRLSLKLTGDPTYLDISDDAALRVASVWQAAAQNALYQSGIPLQLSLRYRNPDGRPHRVRFVALLTTAEGAHVPIPAGEDIVGPRQTLTLGLRASALAGSLARVRVGLVLDGVRQPYPQDVDFAPLSPLTLCVAPSTARQVQVQIENPSGAAFAGQLNAANAGGVQSVPVTLKPGQTFLTVTVGARPDAVTAWRLRDKQGLLAAALAASRLVPYPVSVSAVHPVAADQSGTDAGVQLLPPPAAGVQRVQYQFSPGHPTWRVGEDQPPFLPGRPSGYGLWVYGDGSGNRLGLDFEDNTGRKFHANGGLLAWTGWRFVTFTLRQSGAPLEYPVRLDALLRLDLRPEGHRRAGSLLWKGPTVLYETPPAPHRV